MANPDKSKHVLEAMCASGTVLHLVCSSIVSQIELQAYFTACNSVDDVDELMWPPALVQLCNPGLYVFSLTPLPQTLLDLCRRWRGVCTFINDKLELLSFTPLLKDGAIKQAPLQAQ